MTTATMATCHYCGVEFEEPPGAIRFNGIPAICPACVAEEERKEEAERKAADEARLRVALTTTYTALCGANARYITSEPARFPTRPWGAIQRWAGERPRGNLLIAGETGLCKTRMALWVMRSMIHEGTGEKFAYAHASELSDACRDQFDRNEFGGPTMAAYNARQLLRTMKSADVLLLDDLGKEHATAIVQEYLHGLFEERVNRRSLPTIITTNWDAASLEDRYNEARPLIRRIRTDGTVVVVRKEDMDG